MCKSNNQNNKPFKLALFAKDRIDKYFQAVHGKIEDRSYDSAKVFFHKARFTEFLLGNDEKVVPITYELWPSLSCDARCAKCTYSVNRARKEADKLSSLILADTNKLKSQLNIFKEGGVNSIIITGGGEPTLHPNILDICKYISNLGMKWGMFTHGLHINEELSKSLLQASPSFIRISLNAVGGMEHNKEYRLGDSAYELVKRNLIELGLMNFNIESKASIAAGFSLDPMSNQEQLKNIANEIADIFSRSEGSVSRFSFRPKVVYFYADGRPKHAQKHHKSYLDLYDSILSNIQNPLKEKFGDQIRIENKKFLFESIDAVNIPKTCLSLGWTGQVNHNGDAYVLSELNGSPWSESRLGSVLDYSNIKDFLDSSERMSVFEKYMSGERRLPVNSKISHVETLLYEVRNSFGVFDKNEVNEFWRYLQIENIEKPSNWDFL